MASDGEWDRRSLLRGAAVVGAAATTPLLGGAATAQPGGSDADALFKAGKFEQAGRAYEQILKKDPKNVHAARQRGHVGLLANKFPDAEKYLEMALNLAPEDKETNQLLGVNGSGQSAARRIKSKATSHGCRCSSWTRHRW